MNCPSCGLPQAQHSSEMRANCAVFNISTDAPVAVMENAPDAAPSLPPSAPASGASSPHGFVVDVPDERCSPNETVPPTGFGPVTKASETERALSLGGPVGGSSSSISVASVLLGWCNDIKRELEEFATDGPVGPMVPYRADEHTTPEQLRALEKALGDLIRSLFDLRADVGAAKDAVKA